MYQIITRVNEYNHAEEPARELLLNDSAGHTCPVTYCRLSAETNGTCC